MPSLRLTGAPHIDFSRHVTVLALITLMAFPPLAASRATRNSMASVLNASIHDATSAPAKPAGYLPPQYAQHVAEAECLILASLAGGE